MGQFRKWRTNDAIDCMVRPKSMSTKTEFICIAVMLEMT